MSFTRLVAPWLGLLAFTAPPRSAHACIWDADTLDEERAARPSIADAILRTTPASLDVAKLEARVRDLRAAPRERDASWSNDLGGALVRLGKADEARVVLEAAVARFPNDYGSHANLGTAYHLLGRYADAEREIGRDLDIDPHAHFDLERYHLALLQYLVRDREVQARHVYVDELSAAVFLTGLDGTTAYYSRNEAYFLKPPPSLEAGRPRHDLWQVIANDATPAYRARWNLATDPKLDEGVVYLATLNPTQPACMTMLAVVSLRHEDLNLAATAFEKAAALGAPSGAQQLEWAAGLRGHIRRSQERGPAPGFGLKLGAVAVAVIVLGAASLRIVRRRLTAPRE